MKTYLISKENYSKLFKYLDGTVFRQDVNKDFNRIKFVLSKYEEMFKTNIKDNFENIFLLEK
jgi:hypothetical protein